jgi:phosphatidylinositol alpha-1,6-mannosyltransferase
VRLTELLTDPSHAQALGAAGRSWVEQDWSWTRSGSVLRELLGS